MAPDSLRMLLMEVDEYIEQLFVPPQAVFVEALRDAKAAGLPEINVSPNEGKLLYLLAKISGARRVLEIGLLGAYSTMWLANAVGPQGRLVTLEVDDKHVGVARKNLERAGLADRVEIRHGDARVTLQQMIATGEPPFDLVFIDADKPGYPVYLDCAVQLTRPGGLILADNVIRRAVTTNDQADPMSTGIQSFNRQLAAHPKLESIIVPLMRQHLDGLAIARVRE